MMGKGGQISSDVLVGVVSEQTTRRSSRRGDVKQDFAIFDILGSMFSTSTCHWSC